MAPAMFVTIKPVSYFAIICNFMGILFITSALGADMTILLSLCIPFFSAIIIQLDILMSFLAFGTTFLCILLSLGPHKSWGNAVTTMESSLQYLFGSLAASFGILAMLIKVKNSTIEELQENIERLDTAYQKVADANLDFQTYALFAREEAMEKERRRLAGELHDIIGYSLTNVIMLIQAAQLGKGDSEQIHAILEKARIHADESLREARQALAMLRTEPIDRPRGANLFLKLTKTFQEVTGISITIDFANMPSFLPTAAEKIIYRLIQEGLTNAFRHGRASAVFINFWFSDGNVTVRIRDNGYGVTTIQERPGIGLAGLREQVEQRGGEFKAGPVIGGFLLEAAIPLQDFVQEVNNER
jgi:signal transduction histidine kinase